MMMQGESYNRGLHGFQRNYGGVITQFTLVNFMAESKAVPGGVAETKEEDIILINPLVQKLTFGGA